MKFKSTRHFLAFSMIALIFLAVSSEHPVGRSGAPGDGLCSDCHGGGSFAGTIDISGVPSNAIPGNVYNVTVDVESATAVRAGFQIVALRDAGNVQAGTWSNNGSNSSILTSGGRVYFGHKPFRTLSGGTASWEADWTAPNISDDVTFYMATLLGNGNGSTSGDNVMINNFVTTIVATVPLVVDVVDIEGTLCNGDNNGLASVNISGGMSPYTVQWESGESNVNAMSLSGGMQQVTVTDDNDVEVIKTFTIPEPDQIVNFIEIVNISCFGEEDGEVNLNPQGGMGFLDCFWGLVGEGCQQDDLEAGTYFVTVSDENGCSVVEEIEITEPEELELVLTSTDATSAGNDGTGTCLVNGGIKPFLFEWSNGETESGDESTIENLMPGTYSVLVTDSNDCQTENNIVVGGVTCNISVTANATDVLCYGEETGMISLSVSGISSGVTYLWTTGATTQSLTNLGSGTYGVTVSENAACFDVIDGIVVSEPDTLQAAILVLVNPSCAAATNGRISLGIAGGVEGYDLAWSSGQINDTIINGLDTIINLPDTLTQLGVGNYIYTITDMNGCQIIDSIELINSDVLPPTILLQQGLVLLDANGMAPQADFSLVDAGTFDNCEIDTIIFETGIFSCSDIGIQQYDVTVFDTKGNSAQAVADILIEDEIAPTIDCSASGIVVSFCGEVNYVEPLATDNCEVVTLELVSGLASGSLFPVGLSEITYRATDACNNFSECSFSITVNNDLMVNLNISEASCQANDGSIEVIVTGGTAPYTVEPSNLDNLGVGEYNITVLDSGGCMFSISAVVMQASNNLTVDVITTDVTCHGESDGSVDITIGGGSGIYEIAFEGGVDPNDLPAGIYSYTITDIVDGCQFTDSFEIAQPDEFSAEIESVTSDACTGEILDVQMRLSGGVQPFTVSTEVIGTEYLITLIDATGCEFQLSAEQLLVTELLTIESSIVTNTDDSINGSIDITVLGGSLPYTYNWSDASGNLISTEEDLSNLAAGDYTLDLIDANGCQITTMYTVEVISAVVDVDKGDQWVKIYPNPTETNIRFDFIDSKPEILSIFNAQGQLVKEMTRLDQNSEIDVSEFKSGVYLVRMQYADLFIVKTFIKI